MTYFLVNNKTNPRNLERPKNSSAPFTISCKLSDRKKILTKRISPYTRLVPYMLLLLQYIACTVGIRVPNVDAR